MADQDHELILEIRNFSVAFKKKQEISYAVKQLNLSLLKGSCTAIVGESGSGKTLTALSILQLLPEHTITEGSILLHENNQLNDICSLPEHQIRGIRGKIISMIFQEPMSALNPLMSCGKQVAEMLIVHQKLSKKKAREKTISLFEETELPEPELLYDKYPHQISGGQKQRVMIAMAIACEPLLLIADEPTTALDRQVQNSILQILKKLQKKYGLSILFITHDLALVSKIANRVAVMYKGEIVEQGETTDILLSPEHPYTKALLACRPTLSNKGKPLPTLDDFLLNQGRELLIQLQAEKIIDQVTCSSEPLLRVRNLSMRYPARKNFWGNKTEYRTILDQISFDVWHGETLGVVGESGSGKTTIGKILSGLVKEYEGHIDYAGKPTTQHIQQAQPIIMLFQDPFSSLNPNMTVGEAIAEPIKVHFADMTKQNREDKTIELMEQVGLKPEEYHKFPHSFSGGQRQRICIARALAMQPGFLIFDESVSALDVSIQAQILNLINELKAKHRFTSIFISHDLHVIHYISDRILVMQKGKIVEQGSTEEIFNNPKEEYTKRLLEV